MDHLNSFLEMLAALEALIKLLSALVRLITLLIERRDDTVLRCFCSCLAVSDEPRVVWPGQRCHRGWADAVPAHVHLLGFGEGLAVGAVADDVVPREALGFAKLSPLQHPYAGIYYHIRIAFDGHCDQCQGWWWWWWWWWSAQVLRAALSLVSQFLTLGSRHPVHF